MSNPNLQHAQFIINRKKSRSSSGETYLTYANVGEPMTTVESASYEDAAKAIESAHAAQPAWEKVPLEEKRDIFLRASDILMTPKVLEELAAILASEKGTTVADAKFEIMVTHAWLKTYATKTAQLVGETLPSRVPNGIVIMQRHALGAIFVMAPWNSPVMLAVRGVATPLLCGNTIVTRSSELSPKSLELLVEVFHQAGLPNGVMNLIHIAGEKNPELMPKIIAHPRVRLISFTGGTTVGRILAIEAAKNLKPVVLELGGQGVMIVLNDANVKEAARSIVSSAYTASGQICISAARVIVQREVLEELISEVTRIVKQLKRVQPTIPIYLNSQESGAKVLVGDVRHDGHVVQPHLLLGVTPEMDIWKEEVFGPVVGITIIDTVDEAIDLANNSEYTLTPGLWTRSLKAMEWAARIHVWWVIVNGNCSYFETSAELAGLGGASGWGAHDIENFTHKRATIILPEDSYKPLVDGLKL